MADHLRLVVGGETPERKDDIAASFVALGELQLQGKLNVEQAIVVAVIDGAVTYAPVGTVTLVEAVGLLELASRKVERDMMR